MKIRIEVDPHIAEEELLIKCKGLSEEIKTLNDMITAALASSSLQKIVAYKGEDKEYFLPTKDILFFETEQEGIYAHTINNSFLIKLKLYELEKVLGLPFLRVSKSAIVNMSHIYSIQRNLTSSSLISFIGSHKQVYVSRRFYKSLRYQLEALGIGFRPKNDF